MQWRGSWRCRLHDLDFFPEENSFPYLPSKEEVAVLIEALETWLRENERLHTGKRYLDCQTHCNIFTKSPEKK